MLPVDLSDPVATRASVDKALEWMGGVDMLVNNAGTSCDLSCDHLQYELYAGVSTRALFRDIQEAVHRKVMEIDFFAPWILTHGLIESKIINFIASLLVLYID